MHLVVDVQLSSTVGSYIMEVCILIVSGVAGKCVSVSLVHFVFQAFPGVCTI